MPNLPVSSIYSLEEELATFFSQVSVTLAECDAKAEALVGGKAVPVPIQGVCSYTAFAGHNNNKVVQFRLKSLALPLEKVALAKKVFGSLVPDVTYHGTLEHSVEGPGEDVLVYVQERMPGFSKVEFVMACTLDKESDEYKRMRRDLMTDIARFFATAWNAPQEVSAEKRQRLRLTYETELGLLADSLPESLQPAVQQCLANLDKIMALPMVLTHSDFGWANLVVDRDTYRLTGVIDWAEAEICPFGVILHSLESFTGSLHLKHGWSHDSDFHDLSRAFWDTFKTAATGISGDQLEAIKSARVLGLLLALGFTKRLANEPPPRPIGDDDWGDYNRRYMHGLLVEESTKFDDSFI